MKLRAIPQIPAGTDPQLIRLLSALKENVELLAKKAEEKTAPDDLSPGAPVWDAAGSITLDGSSPTGWGSQASTIDAGVAGIMLLRGDGSVLLCGNCVWDGASWRYRKDGPASVVKSGGAAGTSDIRVAPSGVAGALITWTSAFAVDSTGVILTPAKPSFHAQYSGAGGAATGGTDIIYNLEVFDTLGNYNPANGRFTAPVSGLYFFAWHGLYANATTGDLRTALYKNGAAIYGMRFIDDKSYANWTTFKGSGVVYLAAGDYVAVRCESHSGSIHTDQNYTGFSGFLIG